MGEMTKERLMKYLFLRAENESRMEPLARLKNNAELPAAKEGDGSQHSGANKGKLENAVIRYTDEKDASMPIIESNLAEMEIIRNAINALADPMEREVLRLRYIDGEGCRHTPWAEISMRLYGDDEESHLIATYRVHARALKNIEIAEIPENK
ncbi:MAG: hypothetical protein GX488_08590 [Clostridiales bacterium]|nr:hypothetical protein [Clostridiales bacterium]